jgi:3-oxoacyl-[acyl-carrier protein] reductase
MTRLAGKVALVTGASKGIGAGIAEAFGAEGATVAVNYATGRDGAEAVASRIAARGGRAMTVQGDVTNHGDVKRMFAETSERLGRFDVLVNNAGVYALQRLAEVGEDDIERQFRTNVFGLILASQAAAVQFGPKGGSVINISSIAARAAVPTTSVYAATKGAVDSITQVLAKELGPHGVRVNAISPGVVATEGSRKAGAIGSEVAAQVAAASALGRIGEVDDIAGVAVFLASEEAKWITGQILTVSGDV